MSKRGHIISLFIWGGLGILWATSALTTSRPIWRIIDIVATIMAIVFFTTNAVLLRKPADNYERPPMLDPFKAGWRANLACFAWIIFAAFIASWVERKLNLHGELDELLFLLVTATIAILPVFYLTVKLHKDNLSSGRIDRE